MNDSSPYQPPRSTITSSTPAEYGEIKLSSTQGRLGRVRYISYSTGLMLLSYLLLALFGGLIAFLGNSELTEWLASVIMIIFGLFVLWVAIVIAIQRLHDFDASGWWAILLIVPLANIVLYLVLLIMPGTQGANRFENPLPPNTLGVIILASILPLLFILGIIAAIAIPAYMNYTERAREPETNPITPEQQP